MIDLLRDIEESIQEQGGYSGYLATKQENKGLASSQQRLKVATTNQPAEVSSQSQPLMATNKASKDADSSQLAKLATSDIHEFLKTVCSEYGITRDWLDQFVVCPQDIDDMKNGDLPLACLRAHIEHHLEEQRKWKEFKQSLLAGKLE